MSLDSILLGRN